MVRYLADTSAWVEFFRRTGSPVHRAMLGLVRDPGQLMGCPPVRTELSLDPNDLRRRRVLRVYDGFPSSDVNADDFTEAAEVYRLTRSTGHTPRSVLDCLIVALALRSEATLVHNDVDFDRMAEAVGTLTVLRLPTG